LGIRCILDHLAEMARDDVSSEVGLNNALELIRAITSNDVQASISLKPTALGVSYDPDGCMDRMARIARPHGEAR